jgi:hypothetical protein
MFKRSEIKILEDALRAMTLACEALEAHNKRLEVDIKLLDQEVVTLRTKLQDTKITNTPNE